MAAAEVRSLAPRELRAEVAALYADYTGCLDEERFEDWPNFFVEDCLYKIVPRENFERGLPLATWLSESRNYLLDRVVGIRKTMVYAPRRIRRIVSGLRILGWDGDALEAQAFAYLAVRSLKGLPLSLPATTGVRQPQTGGRRHRPKAAAAI